MRTLVRHQHDTLTAPIWRLCSTVPGRKAAQITPVPNANRPPFFVLVEEAQRMGPLGQISGEIGHSGILRTEPFILASKATPPFAATCRVAATRGLGA